MKPLNATRPRVRPVLSPPSWVEHVRPRRSPQSWPSAQMLRKSTEMARSKLQTIWRIDLQSGSRSEIEHILLHDLCCMRHKRIKIPHPTTQLYKLPPILLLLLSFRSPSQNSSRLKVMEGSSGSPMIRRTLPGGVTDLPLHQVT
jgi:hypothetical protein